MIRLMRPADIPAGIRLREAAGWNQTAQDWENLLALEPEGCWVWEEDGEVAATTTAVCYGRELAWVGMVLVLPEYRRRGLALRLMEHGLKWLETRRMQQVKLDATEMGRPLYEKLGFRTERVIERWSGRWKGHGGSEDTQPELALPVDAIAGMDAASFGVGRTALIRRLLACFPGQGSFSKGEGFILGRPGANAYFLGPFVSVPAAAGTLLRRLLDQAGPGEFFWDLFPDVAAAADLAREVGFERRRSLARMALRPAHGLPPGQPAQVYGAAGFEYG
jgi:GNAT superfamily N-acetyltransferase